MITEPEKQWPPYKTEYEYEVELSTIAYITVKVKASNPKVAGHVAQYLAKGQDEAGNFRYGFQDLFCCQKCKEAGLKLSKESLVVDYVNELPDNGQLELA
jgi:hypothetical protein